MSTSEKDLSDRLRQTLGANATSKSGSPPPLFAKFDTLEERGESAITFTQEDVELMVRTARAMELMHLTRVTAARDLQHGLRSFAKIRAESANAPPAEQKAVEVFLEEESLLLADRLHILVAHIDQHIRDEVLFPRPQIEDITPRRREEDSYWTPERVKGISIVGGVVGILVLLGIFGGVQCLGGVVIFLVIGVAFFYAGAF